MIHIEHKEDCCGCKACFDACPQMSIRMKMDVEGFRYPVVDKDSCTDCGLCEDACPQLHVDGLKSGKLSEPVCYGAIHKNLEVRFKSTAGGMFSALAEEMYRQGGYVGGAVYDETWKVQHIVSNNPKDLNRLRQSKYSQSDTKGFYQAVRSLLQQGEKVLVCGTPCQMAGLRSFLGNKDYKQLVIVDFVCESVTSPRFFSLVLESWARKAKSEVAGVNFTSKAYGWRKPVQCFDFKNGESLYSRTKRDDIFSVAYHGDLVGRPSCYHCKFRGFPRISDITIANFWGCEKFEQFKPIDDNVGTSAVMINTQKGVDYFERVKPTIHCVSADIKEIISDNPALMKSPKYPYANREEFFKSLDFTSVEEAVSLCFPPKETNTVKSGLTTLKMIAKSLFNGLWYSRLHPLVFLKFLYYNTLCKEVHARWKKGALLYITPSSSIDIRKGAKLNLDGFVLVGTRKLKSENGETRFLIDRGGVMNVKGFFTMKLGSDVEVSRGATLNVNIVATNFDCRIICGNRMDLDVVSIGRDVSIRDTSVHLLALDGYEVSRPVVIGDHVWLCSGCTINPGVTIHSGAVVGARAFVISSVPAHSLVAGNPARVLSSDIEWRD
jgi:acetyltransferase-like isoleucine patch superfamily enzyme/coenzyme F420-reducing hydrogenase beta subunit